MRTVVAATLLLAACSIDRAGLLAADATARTDAAAVRDTGNVPDRTADSGPKPPTLPCDDPELVFCGPFDGDLLDRSEANNHPKKQNVGFVEGYAGQALRLTASSRVWIPHNDTLVLDAVGFEMWVHPDFLPATGRMGLLDKDATFGLFLHPGGEIRCAGSISGWTSVGEAVEEGCWTHVACTYDGAAVRVYVDGEERAMTSTGTPIGDLQTELHIGQNAPDGSDPFVGRIDNVRMYRRAHTPALGEEPPAWGERCNP